MKNIIQALTDSYSLEGEFEVQKSINYIENMEDIELLKPYAIKLLQTNAVKKLILDLLKALVKSTDNTVDDQIVDYIEANLWPKEQ